MSTKVGTRYENTKFNNIYLLIIYYYSTTLIYNYILYSTSFYNYAIQIVYDPLLTTSSLRPSASFPRHFQSSLLSYDFPSSVRLFLFLNDSQLLPFPHVS